MAVLSITFSSLNWDMMNSDCVWIYNDRVKYTVLYYSTLYIHYWWCLYKAFEVVIYRWIANFNTWCDFFLFIKLWLNRLLQNTFDTCYKSYWLLYENNIHLDVWKINKNALNEEKKIHQIIIEKKCVSEKFKKIWKKNQKSTNKQDFDTSFNQVS